MNYKGCCRIIIRDSKTQQIKREITQENTICKSAVEKLLIDNAQVFNSNCRVGISTSTHDPDYERTTMDNVTAIGFGESLSGVAGYTYYPPSGNNPAEVIYHNRFPILGSSRTFSIVCLIPDAQTSENNNLASVTKNIYAFLKLQVPITQESNEIVDLFYKVSLQWNDPDQNLAYGFADSLSKVFLTQSLANSKAILYRANSLSKTIISPSSANDFLASGCISFGATEGDAAYAVSVQPTLTTDTALLKRSYSATFDFDNLAINSHVFGLLYGSLDLPVSNVNNTYNVRQLQGTAGYKTLELPSSLTPVYSHSANSTALFYDSNTLATSSWQPVIQTDNSHSGLPTLYSLEVESGGGQGIGTYAIYSTNYSGRPDSIYDGTDIGANAWHQGPTALVSTQAYPGAIANTNDVYFNERWVYPWQNDCLWVSAYNFDGLAEVAIWEIFPELVISKQWSLVSQGVVRINDLAVYPDGNLIYVATEQGLYQINTATDVITQLSSDKAKAVEIGFGGAVFAVLINTTTGGRLASSLNASWTGASDTTGTPVDLNWNNVLFIRCDRDNPSYPLAILEHKLNVEDGVLFNQYNGEWYARLHWWDNANFYQGTNEDKVNYNNTSFCIHPHLTHPYNSSFVVKDGVWITPGLLQGGSFNTGETLSFLNINFARAWITSDANNNVFEYFRGDVSRWQDGSTLLTSINLASSFALSVFKFNTPINGVGLSGRLDFINLQPSIVAVDMDNSVDGYVKLLVGGNCSGAASTTAYNFNSYKRYLRGLVEVAADDLTPSVNDIRGYKNYNNLQGRYFFTRQKSGGVNTEYIPAKEVIALSGNCQALKSGGFISFTASKIGRAFYDSEVVRSRRFTLDQDGGVLSSNLTTTYIPFSIFTWGTPTAEDRLDSGFAVRYGWNSTTSQWEESDVLPGKPLHSTTETAVDGLSIGWTDLNPSNTADLVANQFYTFVNLPQSSGFVNDGTLGSVDIDYHYYLRPTVTGVAIATTAPASPYQYSLPEATSDSLWLTLDPDVLDNIVINIAGYAQSASIINSGVPTANTVLLVDAAAGTLEFASVDEGKVVTGTYTYLKKIHATESL